jgi:hypothetical protein
LAKNIQIVVLLNFTKLLNLKSSNMKNKIIFSALFAILFVTLFTRCNKKTPINTVNVTKSTNLEKIQEDLKAINANYVKTGIYAHKTTKPNYWLVGGADLAAGVGALSESWSWCATGIGGFCAGIFITGSAAVASAAVWNIAPPPGNHGNQATTIANNVGTYIVPNPYGNPYDYRGAQHNEKVKILVQKTFPYTITYSTLAFDSADLDSNELSAYSLDTAHIAYNVASFITAQNVLNLNGEVNYSVIIDHYCGSDNTLKTILHTFFGAFEQISDDSTAMVFINDYENYFINTTTNITDAEKAALLNGFSIGKYSLAMWADALNN